VTALPPDNRVPRLAAGCRVRVLSAQESMLLVPEGVLQLKGAASEILGLIDGERTVDAITLHLQQAHADAPPQQIDTEVKQFIDKLHRRSVLLFKA
jgi:pyrroloquinoline quinone biosynthesis protein D